MVGDHRDLAYVRQVAEAATVPEFKVKDNAKIETDEAAEKVVAEILLSETLSCFGPAEGRRRSRGRGQSR